MNQLPAVVATPGQQALDKARQQLLRERQANSQYASLPVLMGQSEDTGGLQQSAQATECLPPVDNKALKVRSSHLQARSCTAWTPMYHAAAYQDEINHNKIYSFLLAGRI